MMRYKIDIISALSDRGFTPSRLLRDRLLPAQTITNIKHGKMITLDTLNKICCMLRCQPGDLVECVITDDEKIKYFS